MISNADCSAIHARVHVIDPIDAHVCGLGFFLLGRDTNIFNLGGGTAMRFANWSKATTRTRMSPIVICCT
jgi:UDP-glucose 4-epimerase